MEIQTQSQALISFRRKCDEAMTKITDYKEFENKEPMVKLILDTGRNLFDKDLDVMTTDMLLRIGGKLAGVFGYLGQRASYARAERDVYEQKASEVEKELLLTHLDEKYKVTQARAMISKEMAQLREFVVQKEAEKNQWENLVEATSTMISFVQSAIKIKDGERYQNKLQQ